ncbi:MAG: hypothetical protein WBF42_15925 [Terracidiphilus sp.]
MFTGLQTRFKQTRRTRPRAFAVAFVCLVLLTLLTFVQVAHTHPVNTDADHCPLCIVMHSASPVAVTAALITLVQIAVATPVFKVRGISRNWHPQLFTRPPPVSC